MHAKTLLATLILTLPAAAGAAGADASGTAQEERELAAFAGEYASATTRCRFFTGVDGTRLFAQLAKEDPVPLRRTGATTFEYDQAKVFAKAEFLLEDGAIVGVRMTRGQRVYDLRRAVVLGDELARFAGRYASPTLTCRLFIEEERLHLEVQGEAPLALERIGPNVFTHGEPEDGLTVEFALEDGRAASLRLTRGEDVREAARTRDDDPPR